MNEMSSGALSRVRFLLAASVLASTAGVAIAAPVAPADAPADASEGAVITVTARNRAEDVLSVPIPVSVLGAGVLENQHAFTVADLAARVPGLTATTPNARRTGVSLRGVGKTSGNDNMEAAVGVIVDDVFLGHVGMTYQDFTDLQQVEVLHGPQGTLLGKNTSMGAIKYTSKAPSFREEASAEIEGGLSTWAVKARGSYSNALIGDTLAFRTSVFVDKQAGDLININPVGGRWHERNRWGTRTQLLLKATPTLSIKANFDYAEGRENSNTKPYMADPAIFADGSSRTASNGLTFTSRLARSYFTAQNGGTAYAPVIGSWNTIDLGQARPLTTRNYGGALIADWKPGRVEITSISAVRKLHFSAFNDSDQTRFDIGVGGTLVDLTQLSQELRLSGSLTQTLDYQAGIYAFHLDTQTTSRSFYGQDAGAFYATNAQYAALAATPALLQAALANTVSQTYQNPISDSQAAFAQVNWKPDSHFTLTAGLRFTHEYKSSTSWKNATNTDGSALVSTGNATADAVRNSQLRNLYANLAGVPIDHGAVSWLINPSYKVDENLLLYASASAGEKSGAVGFSSAGASQNVAPERTLDFELGTKGQFFDRRLSVNANLYDTRVHNYQATTSIVDPTSSTGYTSVLGNIPGLHARGIEWETAFRPVPGVQATFGGAYNKATYSSWATATCSPDLGPGAPVVCNNTGRQIVGAPLWNLVFGLTVEQPIGATDYVAHGFINDTYRTGQNLEGNLSPLGWQAAYHVTDVGIGVSRRIGGMKYDLSLIASNLFDTRYTTSVNDLSNSSPMGYDGIGARRYVGLSFRIQH